MTAQWFLLLLFYFQPGQKQIFIHVKEEAGPCPKNMWGLLLEIRFASIVYRGQRDLLCFSWGPAFSDWIVRNLHLVSYFQLSLFPPFDVPETPIGVFCE